MSKDQARSPKSYENEELLLAMLPELLEQNGFACVTTIRTGSMKFVDARASDGSKVRFWLKQGWTDSRNYSAIQFGLFSVPEPGKLPDSHFTDYVADRVASAKAKGATHALLVHMVDSRNTNYVALARGRCGRGVPATDRAMAQAGKEHEDADALVRGRTGRPRRRLRHRRHEPGAVALVHLRPERRPQGRTGVEEDHGRAGGTDATAGFPDAGGQPLQVAS